MQRRILLTGGTGALGKAIIGATKALDVDLELFGGRKMESLTALKQDNPHIDSVAAVNLFDNPDRLFSSLQTVMHECDIIIHAAAINIDDPAFTPEEAAESSRQQTAFFKMLVRILEESTEGKLFLPISSISARFVENNSRMTRDKFPYPHMKFDQLDYISTLYRSLVAMNHLTIAPQPGWFHSEMMQTVDGDEAKALKLAKIAGAKTTLDGVKGVIQTRVFMADEIAGCITQIIKRYLMQRLLFVEMISPTTLPEWPIYREEDLTLSPNVFR